MPGISPCVPVETPFYRVYRNTHVTRFMIAGGFSRSSAIAGSEPLDGSLPYRHDRTRYQIPDTRHPTGEGTRTSPDPTATSAVPVSVRNPY